MSPWQTHLVHQLEELHLIQSSLLPDESFAFVLPPEDLAIWSSLLNAFTDAGGLDDDDAVIASLTRPPRQARFQMRVVGAAHMHMSFEVELPSCTDSNTSASAAASISVKGDHVSRDAQERWHTEIRTRSAEIDDDCAFPVYELLTLLTSTLHQSQDPDPDPDPAPASTSTAPPPSQPQPYHALLTSHHLISPTKRRSMQQWSSQLAITGFAKVGYPGIIYAEGPRDAVETFVQNVKGMQWLALRVRFLEPMSDSGTTRDQSARGERWVEVSKIGEVLEQMRMRGREALVTNLGIGAPSKES